MTETKVISSQNLKENEENKNKNGFMLMLKLRKIPDLDWWFPFTALTLCSFITRLSYLDSLSAVTWDEAHFGGFANRIINRTFYPDVHPPLGKILVGAAAYITGYRGHFHFQVGAAYDNTIRYQLIRSEMALAGALLVPIAFLTVFELTKSIRASSLGALGVLCDTFLHKINTLILLDPLLILAISFCVFATVKFDNHRDREWSKKWWGWLVLTGVGLGLVMSIKYIGVFTVLFIGLHTAYQLISIICDRTKRLWIVIPHFLARVLCLIVLPIGVYLMGFLLHFTILTEAQEGVHNGWMHTKLFAGLNNTEYDGRIYPKFVNYGANVTIMSSSPPAGYLDSWFDLFPSELTAPCQVTSTVGFKDPDGTIWRVRHVNVDTGSVTEGTLPTEPPILVRNGDYVMITHMGSGRSLRSHGHRAPFTKGLYQVCTYGEDGSGGPYETWKVIIPGAPEGEPLRVFEHDFILQNYAMLCYLKPSEAKLPAEWAHEGSTEVGCSRSISQPDLNWHINWIESTKVVGETTLKEHEFDFWEKIQSIHVVMFKLNAGLKGNENDMMEKKLITSSPWMWPLAYRMQLLGGILDDSGKSIQFAVAGLNPMVAYMNILSISLQLFLGCVHLFKTLRGVEELPHVVARRKNALWASLWLSLCWGMHYLPFFFMGRVLYVHHYCPAHMYSCLITGVMLNFIAEVTSETLRSRLKKLNIGANCFLLIPSSMILISYLWLYPMATYVEGEAFQRESRISTFLDWMNLGQPWVEFGFRVESLAISVTTEMPLLEKENYENPYLNATLHYSTLVNTTKSTPGYVTLYPTPVQITHQIY